MRVGTFAFAVWLLSSPVQAQEFTTLKGHGGPIMGLAVAPDGQVASASFDNSIGLWEERNPTWLEGHEAAVTAIAALPPDGWLSGGDDFALRIWSDQPLAELGTHKGKIAGIAVTPDGALAATASWDGSIGLWPVSVDMGELMMPARDDYRETVRFLEAPSGVNAVAFATETVLYAATTDGSLVRYDVQDGTSRPVVKHGFGINELIVTDVWIAYGAVDGGTRVVTQEGEEIADFTLDRRPILAMAYHADTDQLAVGDGHGYIMILDTAAWRIARDFRATRQGPVWALAFSPDGQMLYAGGLDDVVYGWPVALLDNFEPTMNGARSFLRDPETMSNGERQFMRKCSICHALEPGPSRKAGPTLHGVFGRRAGSLPGYSYSDTLDGAGFDWTEDTIDALFDQGPDHYIPGSKMPMQVIAGAQDRADLIAFLKTATAQGETE